MIYYICILLHFTHYVHSWKLTLCYFIHMVMYVVTWLHHSFELYTIILNWINNVLPFFIFWNIDMCAFFVFFLCICGGDQIWREWIILIKKSNNCGKISSLLKNPKEKKRNPKKKKTCRKKLDFWHFVEKKRTSRCLKRFHIIIITNVKDWVFL